MPPASKNDLQLVIEQLEQVNTSLLALVNQSNSLLISMEKLCSQFCLFVGAPHGD